MPETVTLVLDDFHQINDRRVLESIGQLLEHQPPQLRLVLTTRSDPTLRLHRLRVIGDLTDIRADDLAFTGDEAAELLHPQRAAPLADPTGSIRTSLYTRGRTVSVCAASPRHPHTLSATALVAAGSIRLRHHADR